MQKTSSGGCSLFLFLLFFAFLILKVTGAVAWSWWWVFSPLWLPAAFVLVALAVMAVMGVSIYKIVAAVLRRQDFGRAGHSRSTRPDGEVLEVQGTEVSTSSPGSSSRSGPEGLPAPDRDAPEGD